MIQEHLSLKRLQSKNISENQELGNLNRSGQKGFATRQLLWDFGIEKVNNQWRFRNKITGFDSSARYFEITDALEVYVSHEYKGFRLQLDNELLKAKSVTVYEQPKKGKMPA
jgi:hypothetical protein